MSASASDRRPESRRLDLSSLRVGDRIGTDRGWGQRRALLEPLIGETTTCELLAGVKVGAGAAPSLGLVKPRVSGHEQTLIDWESGQLARRNWHRGAAEMLRLHRERFLDEMCSPSRDTHFYVGNMHQHPGDFLVLGLWSPPADVAAQGTLGI